MTESAHSNSDRDDYVMVPKVKELKEKKRQLETQLQAGIAGHVITPEAIAEVSRSAIVKGPEALESDITAFIVDTNLLVSHLETFNLVTKEGWAVIIPNSGKSSHSVRYFPVDCVNWTCSDHRIIASWQQFFHRGLGQERHDRYKQGNRR